MTFGPILLIALMLAFIPLVLTLGMGLSAALGWMLQRNVQEANADSPYVELNK